MLRTPVKALTVLGVDPGFASTGLSIVQSTGKSFNVIKTQYVKTKKQDKKSKVLIRSNTDDMRRYREIYTELNTFVDAEYLDGIAVEAYSVFGARGGNAWKTAVVYGGVIFWALCRGSYCSISTPKDLKTAFCNKDTSKQAVENYLCNNVEGFNDEIEKYSKGKREHIADATGHAILLIKEIQQNRVMFGF